MLARSYFFQTRFLGYNGPLNGLVPFACRRGAGILALISILVCATVPCAATGLTWENATVEKTAVEGAPSIDAVFRFKNSSSEPVRVLSLETSCGCTTASLEKMDYAPGEHGELKVTLNLLGRSGVQEKTILVSTSGAPVSRTLLTLRVKIPALFDITPRLLWWVEGEQAKEKESVISTNRGDGTKVVLLQPMDPNVHLRLEKAADGTSYVLGVTPASTNVKFVATIGLAIEAAGHPRKTATIYAQVR